MDAPQKGVMDAIMKKYHLLFISALLGCLCFATIALGADAPVKAIPMSIKAERMVYNADGQTVVFSGNVHVKRADFQLWANTITVYMKKDKSVQPDSSSDMDEMKAGEIDRIEAKDNVRMATNDGRTGTCSKATYYASTSRIVMDGSPVLKDATSYIKGKQIVYYIRDNRTDILGGVEGEFQTSDKNGIDPRKQGKDEKTQ